MIFFIFGDMVASTGKISRNRMNFVLIVYFQVFSFLSDRHNFLFPQMVIKKTEHRHIDISYLPCSYEKYIVFIYNL